MCCLEGGGGTGSEMMVSIIGVNGCFAQLAGRQLAVRKERPIGDSGWPCLFEKRGTYIIENLITARMPVPLLDEEEFRLSGSPQGRDGV